MISPNPILVSLNILEKEFQIFLISAQSALINTVGINPAHQGVQNRTRGTLDITMFTNRHRNKNWTSIQIWYLAWPSFLVWSPPWLYTSSVKNKQNRYGVQFLNQYLVQLIEQPILRIPNFNFSNLRCCKVFFSF